MPAPRESEFTIDLVARTATHVSGAFAIFPPFDSHGEWLIALPTIRKDHLFIGDLEAFARVAKNAAIAAGMKEK